MAETKIPTTPDAITEMTNATTANCKKFEFDILNSGGLTLKNAINGSRAAEFFLKSNVSIVPIIGDYLEEQQEKYSDDNKKKLQEAWCCMLFLFTQKHLIKGAPKEKANFDTWKKWAVKQKIKAHPSRN